MQRARGISPGARALLDGLRLLTAAGDVWALSELWRSLVFDDLATSWRHSKTEVDVLSCLRLMVFNRLCDPGSKLGVLRWLETVALPVDSGVVPEHQHLLRAMDVLDQHSDKLSTKLATLMRPLIDQDLLVVFYDLTTVAVTGQMDLQDDVRAYDMPKSGLIERQFMLCLVQTAEGLPIAHEVHPGNTAEARTLLPMIRGLLARYPLKRVVLIADRGLLSTANIDELNKLQAQLKKDSRDVAVEYILAVPAARYGDFADDLQKLHKGQDATKEWCAETTWGDRRLVVAHDPVAANRCTAARDSRLAELVKLGQQRSVKLDEQDERQRTGKKNKNKGRPMSDSLLLPLGVHTAAQFEWLVWGASKLGDQHAVCLHRANFVGVRRQSPMDGCGRWNTGFQSGAAHLDARPAPPHSPACGDGLRGVGQRRGRW